MPSDEMGLIGKGLRKAKYTAKGTISWVHSIGWQQRNRRSLKTNITDPSNKTRTDGVRAACILDDFSMRGLGRELDLIPISMEDWHEKMTSGIDLLLVEAFWRGNAGTWKGIGYEYNVKERRALISIVSWCKRNGIPTVFWAKEDPSHFSEFLKIAKEFDHVFTTDSGCITGYKVAGKEAKILQFAAQPTIHNPIELYPSRSDGLCFAGSYMPLYPERLDDFNRIFIGLEGFKIDIFDRNLDRNDDRYRFPEKYQGMIKGILKGDEIIQAYKGYRYGLNMNSIKDSNTMFARRVFELMACNTIVVSNSSRGMQALFGDLVICTDDPEEIRKKINEFRANEWLYRSTRLRALRTVMENHTYRDRMDSLLMEAMRTVPKPKTKPIVCLMIGGRDETSTTAKIPDQTYNQIVQKFDVPSLEPNYLEAPYIRAKEAGGLLAIMDLYNHYGPNYLKDLALAFYYSDAAIVTKKSHYVQGLSLVDDGSQYRWTEQVNIGAFVVDPNRVDLADLIEIIGTRRAPVDSKCLSIDEFNFIEGPAPGQPTSLVDI